MTSKKYFNRLLITSFTFIAALVLVRMLYTGTFHHVFLLWNIFLAWIPFALSAYFPVYQDARRWKQIVLFISWLLFFPNALYIVTDLAHLQHNGTAPLWFDIVLLFSSSVLGLLLAFISLHRAEWYLHRKFRSVSRNVMMSVLIFLGSYGVCLGRFGRWNSWDVIHNPIALAEDILHSFIFPLDHLRTWAVTVTLTCLFSIIYGFSRMIVWGVKKTARQ